MSIAERRSRERAERERRITAAAREIASQEGWHAVTVRRLAEAIDYSQPVLYAHFANRDAIVAAVAIEGFRDLAAVLIKAAAEKGDGPSRAAIRAVADAYLAFAVDEPALYAAMFTMPTSLHFVTAEPPPELQAAFAALAAVVPCDDQDTATETFWASLHGLAELERSGRVRPAAHEARVSLAVNGLQHYDAI